MQWPRTPVNDGDQRVGQIRVSLLDRRQGASLSLPKITIELYLHAMLGHNKLRARFSSIHETKVKSICLAVLIENSQSSPLTRFFE